MVRAAQATITPCPTLRPPGREAYREQFADDEERIRRRLDCERPPTPFLALSDYLGRLSMTRTALPSLRAMVRGSLSFTCTWMLSTL